MTTQTSQPNGDGQMLRGAPALRAAARNALTARGPAEPVDPADPIDETEPPDPSAGWYQNVRLLTGPPQEGEPPGASAEREECYAGTPPEVADIVEWASAEKERERGRDPEPGAGPDADAESEVRPASAEVRAEWEPDRSADAGYAGSGARSEREEGVWHAYAATETRPDREADDVRPKQDMSASASNAHAGANIGAEPGVRPAWEPDASTASGYAGSGTFARPEVGVRREADRSAVAGYAGSEARSEREEGVSHAYAATETRPHWGADASAATYAVADVHPKQDSASASVARGGAGVVEPEVRPAWEPDASTAAGSVGSGTFARPEVGAEREADASAATYAVADVRPKQDMSASASVAHVGADVVEHEVRPAWDAGASAVAGYAGSEARSEREGGVSHAYAGMETRLEADASAATDVAVDVRPASAPEAYDGSGAHPEQDTGSYVEPEDADSVHAPVDDETPGVDASAGEAEGHAGSGIPAPVWDVSVPAGSGGAVPTRASVSFDTHRWSPLIVGEATHEIPVHLLFRDDEATGPVAARRRGRPLSAPVLPPVLAPPAASRPATPVDTKLVERPGPTLPGWIAALVGVGGLFGCAVVLWWVGAVPDALTEMFGLASNPYNGIGIGMWALLTVAVTLTLFAFGGLSRGRVGHAWVLTLFGEYRGSVRRTGLLWVSPLLLRRRVDVRLRHWRSEPMPAVDANGTALRVVVLVVWRVRDTVRAALGVRDHEEYLREQVEAAMARVLSQLPADAFHEAAPTLRNAEVVGEALTRMLSAECRPVGLDVFSAQPTRIEYAPEISAAMQRSRIAAIDARHRDTVLTSVVDAVDDTVHRLTSRGLVELDDYERKVLVKDLTVAFYTGRHGLNEGN